MKKFIKKIAQSLMLVPLLAMSLSVVAMPVTASAASCNDSKLTIQSGANCAQGNDTPDHLFGNNSIFKTVTNILLFLVGAISVIMLIVGGIRYVVSAGDQTQVTAAKNTILYAIVGI
ncbi:MAG TPA: hypothetical protein VFK03_04360, partial [Candidatus Saccharimonadales bacterium]|nr:hypothetical protein [Candidatus Saccharimonadales bacterium]